MSELSPSLAGAKVSPFLHVKGAKDAVEFYKTALGARELFRFDSEDGGVVAQLGIGSSEFWVSDESVEFKNFSPATLGGGSIHMVIVVDDPDAVFDHAIAAGAKVECPVRDEEYGWRIGKLIDPFGHVWEIGKTLG